MAQPLSSANLHLAGALSHIFKCSWWFAVTREGHCVSRAAMFPFIKPAWIISCNEIMSAGWSKNRLISQEAAGLTFFSFSAHIKLSDSLPFESCTSAQADTSVSRKCLPMFQCKPRKEPTVLPVLLTNGVFHYARESKFQSCHLHMTLETPPKVVILAGVKFCSSIWQAFISSPFLGHLLCCSVI